MALSTRLRARFDWYEATVEDVDDGRARTALALALGAEITRGKARNGYAECWNLDRGDSTLAKLYGRSARAGELHVVTTSESCDQVVPLIRDRWPAHRVSRADSSVDLFVDFEELDAEAVAFARQRGLKFSIITDSDGGATRRVGSPSSEVFVRVYKKTEQLRALHPDRAGEIPDGVVRFELVARPGKGESKAIVARMSADALWGLGAWTKEFAAEFVDIDAERVSTHFRRPSDWSRAIHFLSTQYGPTIARRVDEVGREQAVREVLEALHLG